MRRAPAGCLISIVAFTLAGCDAGSGLTEEQRKEVYASFRDAMLRAVEEADAKFGVTPETSAKFAKVDAYWELQKDLTTRYIDEVARKYNLSRGQLKEIGREGENRNWPHRTRK